MTDPTIPTSLPYPDDEAVESSQQNEIHDLSPQGNDNLSNHFDDAREGQPDDPSVIVDSDSSEHPDSALALEPNPAEAPRENESTAQKAGEDVQSDAALARSGRTFVADHAYVQADGGKAGALVGHVEQLDQSGTLSVVGVKHQLGATGIGDYIHVWIGSEYYRARITDISADHDRYRAEISPELAKSVLENANRESLVGDGVSIGDEVAFTQLAGVPAAVLREGKIAGAADAKGEVLMLTGAECGPGASGSPVFDIDGQLVGQVLAYDPTQHLTLIASVDQIMDDLQDFVAGRNIEEHASPVSYAGMSTVCELR